MGHKYTTMYNNSITFKLAAVKTLLGKKQVNVLYTVQSVTYYELLHTVCWILIEEDDIQ